MIEVVKFLKAGASSWTVPDGVSAVSVEAIGAGGLGVAIPTVGNGSRRNGGGGGAYAARSRIPVQSGNVIPVQVGGGGSNLPTRFGPEDAPYVLADGGRNGVPSLRGPGGLVVNSVGDIIAAGGTGNSASTSGAGGGGGSASPLGAGMAGGSSTQTGGAGGGSVGGATVSTNGSTGGGPVGSNSANDRTPVNTDGKNGAGGGGSAGGLATNGGSGGMYAVWTSSEGEVAGPGGGGGGGAVSGGSLGYGGGAGGAISASGQPGDGLIVLAYTIVPTAFTHSYWL